MTLMCMRVHYQRSKSYQENKVKNDNPCTNTPKTVYIHTCTCVYNSLACTCTSCVRALQRTCIRRDEKFSKIFKNFQNFFKFFEICSKILEIFSKMINFEKYFFKFIFLFFLVYLIISLFKKY